MIRNIYRRVVLMAMVLLWPALAGSATIEVSAPGQQVISLAVTRILPMDTSRPELAQEFYKVLTGDLEMSGLFRLADSAAFLSDANHLTLESSQVDFEQWRMLGPEAVVKGGYSLENGRLLVEARLFDVVSQKMITGQRYTGSTEEVRLMAHAFADQILQAFTGQMGAFRGKIAYISDQTGFKELYMMNVDGTGVVQLTNHRSLVINPDFSPSGTDLLFTSYRSGNPDLVRLNLATRQESRVSNRSGLNISGRFSPKGDNVALTMSEQNGSDIYVVGASGKRRLTSAWGIDVDPSWSPDGSRLVFVSDRMGSPQLFVMNASGGGERRLTSRGSYNVTPAWSPAGDRIAFSRIEQGHFEIYTIRPDGSDERRLTFGAGNKEHPRWSPDGRFLVFSSDQGGRKALYVMRSDGGGLRRLSGGGGNCIHPAWSPR